MTEYVRTFDPIEFAGGANGRPIVAPDGAGWALMQTVAIPAGLIHIWKREAEPGKDRNAA